MQQRPENFEALEDPEATLVSPRFDANDARRAHPVVPLVETRERTQYAPRVRRGRAPRRSWTPALLAVALLAVAAVGGALATKVMQSPRAEQTQGQTQAVPVQAAEAPPSQPSTPTVTEAPREETPVAARPAARRARTTAAPAAVVTEVDEIDDDEDSESRDKASRKRRSREEDVEKELRKALKRSSKGKGARLIDVLTNP